MVLSLAVISAASLVWADGPAGPAVKAADAVKKAAEQVEGAGEAKEPEAVKINARFTNKRCLSLTANMSISSTHASSLL